MSQFLDDFRTTVSKLQCDFHYTEEEYSTIKLTSREIISANERLLKYLWAFHNHRTQYFFTRKLIPEKIRFLKGKPLNDVHLKTLINLLQKDASLLARLIHFTRAKLTVVERLCFLAFSAFGNFRLTQEHSVYLDSFVDNLLHFSSATIHTDQSPVDNSAFVCIFKVFYANLPCVRRYLLTLLEELLPGVDATFELSDVLSSPVGPSISFDEIYGLLCVSGENNPTDQVYSSVNRLIDRFHKNVHFFPAALSIFLGKYRRYLTDIGSSDELKHVRTLELIVDLFIVQAMLNPLSYGTYFKQHSEPHTRFVWLQTASAFRHLAHMTISSHSSSASTTSFVDTSALTTNLLKRCNYSVLHSTLQQIIDFADNMCSTSQKEISLSSDLGKTSVREAFASELPDVVLLTATDLNILLDVLRLFRSTDSDPLIHLNDLLNDVPSILPGALFGVHFDSTDRGNEAGSSGVYNFKLVQYDQEKNKYINSLKTSSGERSLSGSRLIRRGSPRHGSVPSSLDSTGRSVSGTQSPAEVSINSPDQETVYIIYLDDFHRQIQSKLLSYEDFSKSNVAHTPADTVHPNHLSHPQSSNPAGSSGSQSGVQSSVEDGDVFMQKSEQSIPVIPPGHRQSVDRFAAQTRSRGLIGVTFPSEVLYASDLMNEELMLLSEDRSNDPSSDLSDRSGFTSLASSAHALGRRMRTSARPVNGGDGAGSNEEQIAPLPPTRLQCQTAASQTSETDNAGRQVAAKHTRFSIGETRVNRSCGATELAEQMPLCPESDPSNTLLRTHLTRTSSAEWPRMSNTTHAPPPSTRSEPFDPNRNPSNRSVASSTSSPRSSLNSLQTGLDAVSNASSQHVNRVETCDEMAGIPDREEQYSVDTCSSCGVHLQNGDIGARELGPQANLSSSRLDEEEEALSDLPLSSANVSGRVTPLSFTSSTSRGPTGSYPPGTRTYVRAGLVLPNGAVPSTIIHSIETPDITDKFRKFDLPPPMRHPEAEIRSTISDTWSTDVLPSDTEYNDVGSDLAVSESNNAINHRHGTSLHRHENPISPNTRDRLTVIAAHPSSSQNNTDSGDVNRSTLLADHTDCSLRVSVPQTEETEQVPLEPSTREQMCDGTSSHLERSLRVTLMEDAGTQPCSPSITPLGHSGDAPVASSSSNVIINGVHAFKEGCSKLKDKISARRKSSAKVATKHTVSRSRFPWSPNGSTGKFRDTSARTSNRPMSHKDLSGHMCRSASFTSTNSSQSLNVDMGPNSITAQSQEQRVDTIEGRESVEQMMNRYRRQSDAAMSSRLVIQHEPEEKPTVASHQSSTPLTLEHVKRGLYEIFSHPTVGYVIGEIVDDLSFSLTNPQSDCGNLSCPEDRCLLAILDALLIEYYNFQDIRLTTKLREIRRLLDSLMEFLDEVTPNESLPTDAQTNGDGTSIERKHPSVALRLMEGLLQERKRRRTYFAYLSTVKTRLLHSLRGFRFLTKRWENLLQLQCEDVVFNTIASLVDSQTESVNEFLRNFAENRLRNETAECSDPAPILVRQFVDTLVSKWNETFPTPYAMYQIPAEDPDFSAICARIRPPRSHIEHLVLETLYRSGVWMNDAKLERQCDKLLYREISLYKNSVSMSSLRISPVHQTLYPFPSIQDELRRLDSSHVPSDMIACLRRVHERIMATLSIVSLDLALSADDILPVLIFALIQANPPRLLTNSTFFEIFHGDLNGEEQYLWCQFRAAVSEVRRLISPLPNTEDTQST